MRTITDLIAICRCVVGLAERVSAGGEPPTNTANGFAGEVVALTDLDEEGFSSTGWLTPAGMLQEDDCGEDEEGFHGLCVVHTRQEAIEAWRPAPE